MESDTLVPQPINAFIPWLKKLLEQLETPGEYIDLSKFPTRQDVINLLGKHERELFGDANENLPLLNEIPQLTDKIKGELSNPNSTKRHQRKCRRILDNYSELEKLRKRVHSAYDSKKDIESFRGCTIVDNVKIPGTDQSYDFSRGI